MTSRSTLRRGGALRTTLLLGALIAAPALQAASMSADDFRAAKSRIAAEFKEQMAACDRFTENPRDVCREQAKGKEKVARAELEYNRSADPKDATKLAMTKADASYEVAKEKCDDRSGRDKDICVKEAQTIRAKAMADAKMNQKVAEVRRDAADDKREAEYKLAKEKCDALAGEVRMQCLATAKARYGKN